MTTRVRISIGGGVFLVHALRRAPNFQHSAWGEALLLLSALVLVPMLLDLVGDARDDAVNGQLLRWARLGQLGAALSLVVGYGLRPGILATLVAIPWAIELLLLATIGARRILGQGRRPVFLGCRDAGLVYAAVGAAWMVADRLALRPLGFDPAIVLLTAVHFHYAGLLLPVLTGFALDAAKAKRGVGVIGLGVILGVPAVAVGITATQLRLDLPIEFAASWLMAGSGFAVAWLYVELAGQARWPTSTRILWLVAGLSLGAGMTLA